MAHALSENTAKLRIVRQAGAIIERDGGDSWALLRLPVDDLMSRIDASVEGHVAEFDYGYKLRARRSRAFST